MTNKINSKVLLGALIISVLLFGVIGCSSVADEVVDNKEADLLVNLNLTDAALETTNNFYENNDIATVNYEIFTASGEKEVSGEIEVEAENISVKINNLKANSDYDILLSAFNDEDREIFIAESSFVLTEEDKTLQIDAEPNLSSNFEMMTEGIASDTVTVYYDSNWETTYMHYGLDGEEWTDLPGEEMSIVETSDLSEGYRRIEVELGDAEYIETTFNDGGNEWDNNNEANYIIQDDVVTLEDGEIKQGPPQNELIMRADKKAYQVDEVIELEVINSTEDSLEFPDSMLGLEAERLVDGAWEEYELDYDVTYGTIELEPGDSYPLIITEDIVEEIGEYRFRINDENDISQTVELEITESEASDSVKIHYQSDSAPEIWLWEEGGVPISDDMGYSWPGPTMEEVDGVDDWYVFEISEEHLTDKDLNVIFEGRDQYQIDPETTWYDGRWHDESPYEDDDPTGIDVDLEEAPESPEFEIAKHQNDSISIAWNESEQAVGYTVYRSRDGEDFELLTYDLIADNEYEDNTITEDETYIYKLKAYNEENLASSYSEEIKVSIE